MDNYYIDTNNSKRRISHPLSTLVKSLKTVLNPALIFRRLAKLSFAATLVTIPWRDRLVLHRIDLPPVYGDYTHILLFAADGFSLAMLAFWLFDLALEPRPLRFGPVFLTVPMLGLTVVSLISVPGSVHPLISGVHVIRLCLLAGFYLYLQNEPVKMNWLALPLSLQVLTQAVVGVGQVIHQGDLGLQLLGEYRLDPAWEGVSIVWMEGLRTLRAYGLSDHPNILGGSLAFALILIAAWHRTLKPPGQILVGAIYALGLLGLLLTFSRSAWLAWILAALLVLILLFKSRRMEDLVHSISLMTASLIVVVPFLFHYAEPILGRLNQNGTFTALTPEAQSLGSRFLLNQAANQIFASHPLTGVGVGAFPVALRQQYPEFPIDYQPAHFVLLDVAAETGIFGALFYSLAMAVPWMALWLNRRRMALSPEMMAASGLLLAVTVVGLFDYYTWLLVPGRLWQWLAWGLWAIAYRDWRVEASHA